MVGGSLFEGVGLRADKIIVFADRQQLNQGAAERWVELYEKSLAENGFFHVALAGGSTPRQLYQLLAHPQFADRVNWQNVHIYFGDERFVPAEHAESNFRMAKEALLDHVPVPSSNVHRIETDTGEPHEVASRYEKLLMASLPKTAEGIPQFDLILLGIGPDGHTASLFPGTDILQQRERFVAAVYVKQKSTWRISLTFPVIDAARHLMFLVAGEDKSGIIGEILSSCKAEPVFPVQMLNPAGEVEFYLDREAAAELGPAVSARGE